MPAQKPTRRVAGRVQRQQRIWHPGISINRGTIRTGGLGGGGGTPTPVPLKGTVCGESGTESTTTTEAVRTPAAVGANVTPTLKLAPGGSDPGATGQLLLNAKSPGFAPVVVRELMSTGTVPTLVRTTVSGAEVPPTVCAPKASVGGAIASAGPTTTTPVPVSGRTCGPVKRQRPHLHSGGDGGKGHLRVARGARCQG